jgi:hypothetical protein
MNRGRIEPKAQRESAEATGDQGLGRHGWTDQAHDCPDAELKGPEPQGCVCEQ